MSEDFCSKCGELVSAGHKCENGVLVQLGERCPCKAEVVGSNPTGSTIKEKRICGSPSSPPKRK